MIDLSGKVVLVTGASRGIGAATARVLAGVGAEVILHSAGNRKLAEDLADEIGPDRCHLVSADLSEPGAGRALWQGAVSWQGRIDVLVNNAGVYEPAGLDVSDEDWDAGWARTLQINLIAAADLCREAVRHFQSRGAKEQMNGTIINIASRAAHRGEHPDYASYAASKAGMVGLSKTLARAYGQDGVLVYAVAPGFVETDMARDALTPESRQELIDSIPLGDLAQPSDVANTVAFLASGLAPHATGATIDINGASYVR